MGTIPQCNTLVTLNLAPEQRLRLQNLAGTQNGEAFRFLGFSLNLQTGEFIDELQKGAADPEVSNPTMHHQITELLLEYSGAAKKILSRKQVKFRMFPGGIAYENAFLRKAVDPIAKIFAAQPELLVEAGILLGGRKAGARPSIVEIPAFNLVPITYILWVDESCRQPLTCSMTNPPTATSTRGAGEPRRADDLATHFSTEAAEEFLKCRKRPGIHQVAAKI